MTLLSTDFHLCPEGTRLYLAWSSLEEKHDSGRKQAKAEYYQHREICGFCTPPGRLEKAEEGEI